ncbi:hypothetical protein D9757_009288 [Collybiopsis confluens]|uniref:Transmembrane protein n=1 Tax=Collybiopsis confluens TaxID=2823264 RepID=A0A8H5HA81_9AGAR|nr:hypothetical protein D9757_009288 [Collybiopsis confluens]
MEQSSQASVVPSFKAGSSDFLTFVLTVTPLVHDYAASAPPPPSSDTDLIMITSFMLDATSFPFTTVPVAPVRTSSVTVFPVPEDVGAECCYIYYIYYIHLSLHRDQPPNTWQSAGFDSVVTTTSTSSFTATSDGHLITGTTLVPFTTTLTSMLLYAAQSSAATAIQLSGNKSHVSTSTLIPAIVGSLVGALAFGVGIFLYLRCRSRLRQRAFHRMTPSIDIEESAAAQPTRQLARLEKLAPEEAVNLDEPSTTRNSAQSLQQLETQQQWYSNYPSLNHENLLLPPPADDSDLRAQMTEMRVTMERVLTHVQRLESRVGSTRRGRSQSISMLDGRPPSISTSDGRPPTYVSSGN